jgi:phospholipid/cholesterol/gamma-HCH transport system ATP-binding protein
MGFEDYMPVAAERRDGASAPRSRARWPWIRRFLFFDEPSAGLDPIIAAGMDAMILELKKAFHMTIIVVTHELASAFLIADRIVLIDKGRVVAVGTVDEMRASAHPARPPVPRPQSRSRRWRRSGLSQMLTDEPRPGRRSAGPRGE